jgi:transposase InsO family protein
MRAKLWDDSDERDAYLKPWTDFYNYERPHGSLDYRPPISRSESGTTS